MESEWRTRKTRIDPRLDAIGWPLEPERAPGAHRTEEHPTDAGSADYALCVGDRVLGVVEAKKVTVGPQNVLTQAERYSRGLRETDFNFEGFRAPFLYSTNGEVTWFHDVRHPLNRSRQVAGFHTPDALQDLLARDHDALCARLAVMPNDGERLRPYQREANEAIEQAIADRKRHMLVAMATGTGKTFTMVNEVYRLLKAGVARRVLFLVDRRALAAQAVRAFASFEPEPGLKFNKIYEVYSSRFQTGDFGDDEPFDPTILPINYLADPSPDHAFVYVCTIQRMAMNVLGRQAIFGTPEEAPDDDADALDIPIHAFDVIVADECHRGYTAAEQSVWRSTLNHFDSIKIGLTATPAAHTTSYFKHLVFRYDYKQAVAEGFLVDYDVVSVRSDVRMHGVFLQEGEDVEVVDTETGRTALDQMEDERQYDASEVESRVTAPDSNRRILAEIKKYADEHEAEHGHLPKTLIFALNDLPHTSHCDQLVDLARDVFGQGDAFVQKITGRVDRPLQRIREFRNRPHPGIAVTVDLLTTGVDIPDLEYIVLLRPVKSRILFEQMLGRGTRKGEKHLDKSHFVVFDCFDGTLLEYFAKTTGLTAEAPVGPSRTIVEIIADVWNNVERDYNVGCLVKRLHRVDKQMSGEAREMFAVHVQGGDVAAYARSLPAALARDFVGEMALLRDPAFQDLLQSYPRPKRQFLRATGVSDVVESEWLVRGPAGQQYKPAEYLEQFQTFVCDNQDEIDAIRILLDRPADWSPSVLSDLKQRLTAHPLRFSIDRLQRAHQERYHRALVDVISMVKHAANAEQPLLTAAERVDQAIARVTAGKAFTPEQQAWLDRIRQHLHANLSIDEDDFGVVPELEREGGWGAFRRVFGTEGPSLLHDLNEGLAA